MVIVGLAHDVVICQQYSKHTVDFVEVAHRLVHEDLPEPECLLIPTLQHYNTIARSFNEFLIQVEFPSSLFVESVQISHSEFIGCIVLP